MVKFLETRKVEFKNGKPKVSVKRMEIDSSKNPSLKKRGKGFREVYEKVGPEFIGPGTRKK